MPPHHLLLCHGGDEDAFEVGGNQTSAPRGDRKSQLITIHKDCSQALGGITIFENHCPYILVGNAYCKSHQLKHSAYIFQQLGATSKFYMPEE
jgi:hypothetical protein